MRKPALSPRTIVAHATCTAVILAAGPTGAAAIGAAAMVGIAASISASALEARSSPPSVSPATSSRPAEASPRPTPADIPAVIPAAMPSTIPAPRTLPVLVDVTARSNIRFKNLCGAPAEKKVWLTEAMGSGAAWLDYDGDGTLDLYLVNGSAHDRAPLQGQPGRLYRGDGKGRFVDVTEASGAASKGWGMGVAVGDYDNDGDPDIYVTSLGPNVLLRNNGNGTFTDVTTKAGVGQSSWSTSAAFFDMDGDGDLDLYVCRYVEFDPRKVPKRGSKEALRTDTCMLRGVPVFCGPLGLPPAQDVLYRNNGDGTFTDVTRPAGVWLDTPSYALAVVTGDFDNDGDQDVYVANDSVPNSLWRNRGDGTFEDAGMDTLTALTGEGTAQAGMGTDFGDYDNDGWLDIVVTNFSSDLKRIYRNSGGSFFTDESLKVGMLPTYMRLSWGVGFHDIDNDGDLDLFIANGHVYPQVDDYSLGTRFRQQNDLFVNEDGRFEPVPPAQGLAVLRSFRAAAFADYDVDGGVDVLVTALDDSVLLLHNETPARGHYLEVRLVGSSSNRDGVGGRVAVTAAGRRQIRERKGGGSYLSASDPRLHFGLGQATRADLVEVSWPSGRKEAYRDVAADRAITIKEGSGIVP